MDEREERAYVLGGRSAWRLMLGECLRQLGYDDPEAGRLRWIAEREDAVAQLRILCEDHGDNAWGHGLYLADVIANHLARHLDGGDDTPREADDR